MLVIVGQLTPVTKTTLSEHLLLFNLWFKYEYVFKNKAKFLPSFIETSKVIL